MTKNKDYLDAMNKMDEQLTPVNKKYFSDLRSYMLFSSFFNDERAVNEQIYQMYLDFLNAQNEGLTATDFFGNNPKNMADELLENLPKTPFKNLVQYTGIVGGILWATRLFFDFSSSAQVTINPALYLFDLLIGFGIIIVIFKLIQNSIYKKSNNLIEGIVAGIAVLIYIVLYIKAELFIPTVFTFTLPFPWDILLIVSLGLIVFFVTLVSKEQAFYSIGFLSLLLVTFGILKRYEVASANNLSISTNLFILIIFGIAFYFTNKKFKKTD